MNSATIPEAPHGFTLREQTHFVNSRSAEVQPLTQPLRTLISFDQLVIKINPRLRRFNRWLLCFNEWSGTVLSKERERRANRGTVPSHGFTVREKTHVVSSWSVEVRQRRTKFAIWHLCRTNIAWRRDRGSPMYEHEQWCDEFILVLVKRISTRSPV